MGWHSKVPATVADASAAWFGTLPYLSGQGPRGGIARYDLATEAWRVYTKTHNLPAYTLLPETPAPVYALAMGEDGIPKWLALRITWDTRFRTLP